MYGRAHVSAACCEPAVPVAGRAHPLKSQKSSDALVFSAHTAAPKAKAELASKWEALMARLGSGASSESPTEWNTPWLPEFLEPTCELARPSCCCSGLRCKVAVAGRSTSLLQSQDGLREGRGGVAREHRVRHGELQRAQQWVKRLRSSRTVVRFVKRRTDPLVAVLLYHIHVRATPCALGQRASLVEEACRDVHALGCVCEPTSEVAHGSSAIPVSMNSSTSVAPVLLMKRLPVTVTCCTPRIIMLPVATLSRKLRHALQCRTGAARVLRGCGAHVQVSSVTDPTTIGSPFRLVSITALTPLMLAAVSRAPKAQRSREHSPGKAATAKLNIHVAEGATQHQRLPA